MLKRLFLLTGVVLMTAVAAMAAPADIKCTGQVVDEHNDPMIGAMIVPAGTNTGTTSDIDGRLDRKSVV